MSGPTVPNRMPITDIRQLAEDLEKGCKPPEDYRIGTEHEKLVFCAQSFKSVSYKGDNGIERLLTLLKEGYDWEPVMEGENIIGLKHEGASVSLEPGGQVELSGAPLKTIHETCDEVHTHLAQMRTVGKELGIAMLGTGFAPTWARGDIHWMPKQRYKIMRNYMQKVGTMGLDMMLRTCTVQVNLDFSSEADMAKKFRASLALQPIATALFANSPFKEGQPNGFQSLRSHVWTDTDPDRTGDIPFVFEDGFGFERYVDYLLDMPMYFVYRDGTYIDVAGQSFRDFMEGRLPGLPGERPILSDWHDHQSTAFPEVRLKRFLEMRGADGGPWNRLCALPAFWVGLLYDQAALDEAHALVADWTEAERAALRRDVPRLGLNTPFRDRTVLAIAREAVEIAERGLKARARLNGANQDESAYLRPLQEAVETGRSLADELLDRFHGKWGGTIEPIFREFAY